MPIEGCDVFSHHKTFSTWRQVGAKHWNTWTQRWQQETLETTRERRKGAGQTYYAQDLEDGINQTPNLSIPSNPAFPLPSSWDCKKLLIQWSKMDGQRSITAKRVFGWESLNLSFTAHKA
ncbi:uncharacterized protein LOC144580671 [Callithrix jacchus]